MVYDDTIVNTLMHGGIAVIATDTIYGVVGQALIPETVERIYTLKQRTPEKPCIILIDQPSAMKQFGVSDEYIQKVAEYPWSGPTSFVVPIDRTDLRYLDRGTMTLAFRIPHRDTLRHLLVKTGPLIAPSANTEGCPPATTIAEARYYFGDAVAYCDGGHIEGAPSRLVAIATNTILR